MQGLAQEVACYLGLDLGGIKIKRFADGEIYVQVQVRCEGWAAAVCQEHLCRQPSALAYLRSSWGVVLRQPKTVVLSGELAEPWVAQGAAGFYSDFDTAPALRITGPAS